MFNLPNNTPYIVITETSNGYILISSRWVSHEEGEVGPQTTFECYETRQDALAAIERFMEGKEEKEVFLRPRT